MSKFKPGDRIISINNTRAIVNIIFLDHSYDEWYSLNRSGKEVNLPHDIVDEKYDIDICYYRKEKIKQLWKKINSKK